MKMTLEEKKLAKKKIFKAWYEKNKKSQDYKDRKKKWNDSNRDKIRKTGREKQNKWNREHREEANRRSREQYLKNIESRRSQLNANSRERNKTEYYKNYHREYMKKRRLVDLAFKIKNLLRGRIWAALKGGKKSTNTMKLVGCSIEEFKNHLEKQFKPGMSWDNQGMKGWHIDHIKPCSSFDLTDPEQQRQCFNWTNMQPLWAHENFTKSDSLPT